MNTISPSMTNKNGEDNVYERGWRRRCWSRRRLNNMSRHWTDAQPNEGETTLSGSTAKAKSGCWRRTSIRTLNTTNNNNTRRCAKPRDFFTTLYRNVWQSTMLWRQPRFYQTDDGAKKGRSRSTHCNKFNKNIENIIVCLS